MTGDVKCVVFEFNPFLKIFLAHRLWRLSAMYDFGHKGPDLPKQAKLENTGRYQKARYKIDNVKA